MKFDLKLIGYITTFENYTKTTVKDCFFHEKDLVFIVKEGQLGKAIGRNGAHVKVLTMKLKHKLRIIGFDEDPVIFVKNLIYPIEDYTIETRDNNTLMLKPKDRIVKGKIFGRDKTNFYWIQNVLQRHFKDIKLEMF